ncbi:YheT family hydrolase [Marinicella meishanensis]|uniref:YheT family hydrolase n=1 Tax=Marinicella meishanensis TaxID=2873263 RepID=UPI001CC056A8|nr:alpha/beta fold hydrolase [Marinicella sp. NBU2979]
MVICQPPIRPKNKHLQSILASSKIRLWRLRKSNPVVEQQIEQVLHNPHAKLLGFHTPQPQSADTMAILLHGWEGSSQSTYIQLLADSLYRQGMDIYRLNLRDHGDSHHMNEDLFHSCRIEEVVHAMQDIQTQFKGKQFILCGFSLGGNFALRVAARAQDAGLDFRHVYAVSPPIIPKHSMQAIHASKLYNKYFLRKWKRSLHIKHDLFPHIFDNDHWQAENNLERLTQMLIVAHTEYTSTDDYFNGYSITPEVIDAITHPTHVITAWDDPVIPFEDFSTIDRLPQIKLLTTAHGGHCGFILGLGMRSWIEDHIIEETQS